MAPHDRCEDVESLSQFESRKRGLIDKEKIKLSPQQSEEILAILKSRFEENKNRHKGIQWPKLQAKLETNHAKMWSLHEMEQTGGEPDVIGHDKKTDEYIFVDCSSESPQGRRNVCYDSEAMESRKKTNHKTTR